MGGVIKDFSVLKFLVTVKLSCSTVFRRGGQNFVLGLHVRFGALSIEYYSSNRRSGDGDHFGGRCGDNGGPSATQREENSVLKFWDGYGGLRIVSCRGGRIVGRSDACCGSTDRSGRADRFEPGIGVNGERRTERRKFFLGWSC